LIFSRSIPSLCVYISEALKSFGLAAIMCRMAMPISTSSDEGTTDNDNHHDASAPAPRPRIDFFDAVLVDIGDSQDVLAGQSTLMAKLSASSRILQHVSSMDNTNTGSESEDSGGEPHVTGSGDTDGVVVPNETPTASSSSALVLLDELGSGTDPEAGAAISRAILEELMTSSSSKCKCRVVVTTHSPELKFLPRTDSRFRCASVLLEDGGGGKAEAAGGLLTTLPSFRLSYDTTGESYALGAASRCQPPFPRSVIEKAAELLTDSSGNTEMDATKYLSLQDAMQTDRDVAQQAREQAQLLMQEAQETKEAMLVIAKQYEARFGRLEHRLEEMWNVLQTASSDDEGERRDAYDVVGDSLAIARLVKRRAQTDAEILAERGLKVVSFSYPLRIGEQVVIIAKDHPWEGESAEIADLSMNGDLASEIVTVQPALGFGIGSSSSSGLLLTSLDGTMKFSRRDLAIWDYSAEDLFYGSNGSASKTRASAGSLASQTMSKTATRSPSSSLDKVDNLFSVMGSLSSSGSTTASKKATNKNKMGAGAKQKFVSSRQRKAASKGKKK
jgi:hypothetical protein